MRRPGRQRYVQVGIVAGCLACGLGIVSTVHADIGPGDPPGTFSYLGSDDAGTSFVPRQLDDVHEDVTITHVEASRGAVHAVFDTNTEDPLRKVFYRRSTDGGTTFAPSVRLDVIDAAGRPSEGDSSESHLDVSGDTVHVVWEDDPVDGSGNPDPCCEEPNRDDVMYTHSTDEGRTFAVPVNVTSSPDFHNRDPNVAADGDLVAIVYEGRNEVADDPALMDDDVRFVRSTDGGATWGSETNLTNAFGEQDEPAVDVAGNTVHVVFRDSETEPPATRAAPTEGPPSRRPWTCPARRWTPRRTCSRRAASSTWSSAGTRKRTTGRRATTSSTTGAPTPGRPSPRRWSCSAGRRRATSRRWTPPGTRSTSCGRTTSSTTRRSSTCTAATADCASARRAT